MFLFKKNNSTASVGKRGEQAAVNYLKRCGYKILEVNYVNKTGRRLGEIDIIAKEKSEIVFVEVKTRCSSDITTRPEENINRSKLYKINKAANHYLKETRLLDVDFRFDAITLLVNQDQNSARLRHLKNIFY